MALDRTITDSISKTVEQPLTDRKRKKPAALSQQAVNLAPSAGPARIKNEPRKPSVTEADKPSEKMKKRQAEREENISLGETLAEAAAMFPAGTGPATNFLKSAASGAAAGATLGEYVAKAKQQKAQAGKKKKAKTLAEKSYDTRGAE